MKRLKPFSPWLATVWALVSCMEAVTVRHRIVFERQHGVASLNTYAFLAFWGVILVFCSWSLWQAPRIHRKGSQVD